MFTTILLKLSFKAGSGQSNRLKFTTTVYRRGGILPPAGANALPNIDFKTKVLRAAKCRPYEKLFAFSKQKCLTSEKSRAILPIYTGD
ncbi:MAG: hypothetical protein FWE44_07805 [Defluviitaleaceae bacterium]|nr:hypothetical protein [Defluviitaleaceae bacterium]